MTFFNLTRSHVSFVVFLFGLLVLPVFVSASTSNTCGYDFYGSYTCPTSYDNNLGVYPYTSQSYDSQSYDYRNAYYGSTLSCAPYSQTISLGQSVVLSVVGGYYPHDSNYTWNTPDTVYAAGSTLTFTPRQIGMQTVTVSDGSQTAVCTVNVTGYGGVSTGGYYGYPSVVASTYIPALPNTGFEPHGGAAWATALLVLMAVGGLFFPYVRKAIAIAIH